MSLLFPYFQPLWVELARQRAAQVNHFITDNCDPRDQVFQAGVHVNLRPDADVHVVLAGLEASLSPSPVIGHLRFL